MVLVGKGAPCQESGGLPIARPSPLLAPVTTATLGIIAIMIISSEELMELSEIYIFKGHGNMVTSEKELGDF